MSYRLGGNVHVQLATRVSPHITPIFVPSTTGKDGSNPFLKTWMQVLESYHNNQIWGHRSLGNELKSPLFVHSPPHGPSWHPAGVDPQDWETKYKSEGESKAFSKLNRVREVRPGAEVGGAARTGEALSTEERRRWACCQPLSPSWRLLLKAEKRNTKVQIPGREAKHSSRTRVPWEIKPECRAYGEDGVNVNSRAGFQWRPGKSYVVGAMPTWKQTSLRKTKTQFWVISCQADWTDLSAMPTAYQKQKQVPSTRRKHRPQPLLQSCTRNVWHSIKHDQETWQEKRIEIDFPLIQKVASK